MTMPVLRICRIAEVLQSAGFRKSQAKTVASLIRSSRGLDRSLMTREDLQAALKDFERRLTIRLGLMMLVVTGLAFIAAKFL